LLAYVAVQPERSVPREEIAGLLWGDYSEKNARQALRQCLASLREDLATRCAGCLVLEGDTIGLNPQRVWVDAVEFIALSKSSQTPDLQRAIDLYRGDLLANFKVDAEPFDEWLRVEQRRLWETAAELFQHYAERMSAAGLARPALEAAERLVAHEPLREDWHRLLLRLYARHRGREAALARAQTLSALLKRELHVHPETETVALVEQIRRGAFASPSVRSEAQVVSGNDSAPVHSRGSEKSAITLTVPSALVARTPFAQVRNRGLAFVGFLAVVLIAFAVLWPGRQHGAPSNASSDRASDVSAADHASAQISATPPRPNVMGGADRAIIPIFVVPLRTHGEDADPRVADAITDDLIYRLARFSGLRVASRDTAYLYAEKLVDPAMLGAIFGVHYVTVGSLSMQDTRARITIELIDTRSRLTVWTERWEAESLQLRNVSDEIVKRLTRKLQVEATYAESHQPIEPAESDVKALLAKALAAQYGGQNAESVQQALSLYEEALRREPDLVLGMVGVAAQLITAHNNYLIMPTPDLNRAEMLLHRALKLDPEMERVHYWLGHLHYAKGEYDHALASFQLAFELNSSFAPALANAGRALVRLRRPKEGLAEIERAMRLEPKGPVARFGARLAGEAELEIGNYRGAIEWLERATSFEPANPLGHALLAASYFLAGETSKASEEAANFTRLANPLLLADLMGQIEKQTMSPEAPQRRFLQGLQMALSIRR